MSLSFWESSDTEGKKVWPLHLKTTSASVVRDFSKSTGGRKQLKLWWYFLRLHLVLNINTKHLKIILFYFTLVTLSRIPISTVHQPSVLFRPQLEMFMSLIWNWKELAPLLTVSMGANSCCKIAWATPMGSWRLNDPPLTNARAQNLMIHPLSAPPPRLFGPLC